MINKINFSSSRLLIICSFFLLSRIFLTFLYQAPGSDTRLYGQYAFENREASRTNTTIYEYHEGVIEYPPLAIMSMSFPMLFVQDRSNELTQDTFYSWKRFYSYFCFAFDATIFWTILLLLFGSVNRLKVSIKGLAFYLISGLLLFNFLYDRLDFYLGGIIFFAFLLLMSRKHWMFTFTLLAVGINFKLIPILLVPLFLIGSLPVKYIGCFYKDLFNWKLVQEVLIRSIFLIAVTVLLFLPFYFWGGKHTLDFLTYHSDRGLQLESTYSSILMMLNYVGFPVYVTHEFGAFNLESSFALVFSKVSTLLVFLSVSGILFLFIKRVKDHATKPEEKDSPNSDQITLAQYLPQTFLCLTIATLLASIAASKVFSPQYLLWVVPLFGLVSYQDKSIKIAGCLFLLVCLLTALIYPYTYFTDFVHNVQELADGRVVWEAPTMFAANLLFLRNLLLIGTIVMLCNKSSNRIIKYQSK